MRAELHRWERHTLLALLLSFGSACQAGGTAGPERAGAPVRSASVDGLKRSEPVIFSPSNELVGDVSPDGRFLAYVSDETGNLDVWLYDHRTRSSLPFTKSGAEDYDPAFSPDGQKLVFVSRRLDAKGDLFLLGVSDDSDEPERLTEVATLDRQPVFAPDGQSIFYTASAPVGVEHIYRLQLSDRSSARISPSAGFDPSPSLDGRYLVYTAPEGEGGIAHPHLVLMRLSDSSTRALTLAEDGPSGFARPLPPEAGRQRWAFVRFPHDDNGDGVRDAADQASLWRVDVDPEALFAGDAADRRPAFPLTSGARNELFPVVGQGLLYFTESVRIDRDVARLPLTGSFPVHTEAARYNELAKTLVDPRERWFAYLAALAIAKPGESAEARAWLGVANEHLAQERWQMAEDAFSALVRVTQGAEPESREREFGGIAEVELLALARRRQLESLRSELARERVLRDTQRALEILGRRYQHSSAVLARVELEGAEILVERGDRLGALDALDRIEQTRADQPYSVARAMLRRVELLRVAFDPNAIGEAYRKIAERFPEERDVVREAAVQTVEAYLASARLERDGRPPWDRGEETAEGAEVDVLRRLVERSPPSPLRLTARERLANLLEAAKDRSAAAQEFAALVEEYEAAGDRLGAARALSTFAEVEETLFAFEPALESWTRLREVYSDLPGIEATAREAVTRVALAKADREERLGQRESARASYRAALDNDPGQVRARRRHLALSAQLGLIDEVLEETKADALASTRSPIAHYAYGLAATWISPPDLGLAETELSRALQLNPQLVHGYITRGWVYENRYIESKNLDWLEKAMKDYEVAIRLNREAVDLETEADAMLNLGNAAWSLGVATNDDGNVRRAYSTYVERLQTGVAFREPVQEAVFWERLSRAAFWAEDWAMSVTAGREALRLAESLGLSERVAQIHGNLALAYGEAGAHEASAASFFSFASALEARELTQRLVVAKRSRAVSRVRAAIEEGEVHLGPALRDLGEARAVVEGGGYDAPKPPFTLARAVPDASRGPLGLWLETEREVNLYWAERAHLLQGDLELARGIHELRLELLAEETDDSTKVSLNGIRVHLGALVRAARSHAEAGRAADCARRFEEAFGLLLRWRDDGGFGADRPSLLLDEARLQAVFLEAMAGLPPAVRAEVLKTSALLAARVEDTAAVAEVLLGALPDRAKAITEAEFPETPKALLGYVNTASISADVDEQGGATPLFLLARLGYAEALLDLAAPADREASPGSEESGDLQALLERLDQGVGRRRRLAAAFVRAARWSARVSGPKAARLHVAALEAASDVLGAAESAAPKTAERELGRLRAIESELLHSLQGGPEAVEAAGRRMVEAAPLLQGEGEKAVNLAFARSASIAMARGELTRALDLVDRQLLRSATGGRLAKHARPARSRERAFVSRYRSLLAALERDEREEEVSAPGVGGEGQRFDAVSALAALRETPTSEALGLRLFADSAGADVVKESLAPDEVLLTFGAVDGLTQLFLVDGSTTAATPFVHLATELPIDTAKRAVAEVREALLLGRPAPAEPSRLLDAQLLEPLAARFSGARTVILADQALGGPLPAWALSSLRGVAVSHVSAPSSLVAARSALLVGELPSLVIQAAETEPPILPSVPSRLGPGEALGFRDLDERRRGEGAAPPAPGETKRVDARPVADRIAGGAFGLVVVDAPFRVAERVPERGEIDLGGRRRRSETDVDRGADALVLGDLDLPSRALVLAETELSASGTDRTPALLPLDLAMAAAGTASLVVLPSSLDRATRARIVERFSEAFDRLGAARALEAATRPELDRHPGTALVTLIGSPGLDEKGALELAEASVGSVRSRANDAVKAGDVRTAAEWAKHLARLQAFLKLEVEHEKAQRVAVLFLVQAGQYAEAAERQKAWIESREGAADVGKAAADWLLLGQVYSLARDYEAAEEALVRAIELLGAAQKPAVLAAAHMERAGNHVRWLRYDQAAVAYEEAIRIFQKAGAYDKGTAPAAALDALRSLAELYLNRLSDPEKARVQYQRYLRHTGKREDQVATTLSLAQVARKLGEFDRAAALAEEARRAAAEIGRADLELEALTEATNVSWYQGDYARGLAQCTEGLQLAETNLKKALADKTKKSRRETRGLIYTLSVCGVLHMSTRDFEQAKRALDRAAGLARRNDFPAEEAAQYNNLGRVYLEFGRLDRAKESFLRAKALDERLSDRFGLGYDYRNLGTALFLQGRLVEARKALETALELSNSVNDPNNVLRATFALAELAREEGRDEDARGLYEAARVLAERLSAKDLAWQIHRALGLIEVRAGRREEAEGQLRRAVRLVRSLTGRSSGTSDTGPPRYQALDDLLLLLLDDGRNDEAFALSELARALAETEVLDDRRVQLSPEEASALMQLRQAQSSTAAAAAALALGVTRPRMAALFTPAAVEASSARLPEDARVVSYRMTERELVIFVLGPSGLGVVRRPLEAKTLRRHIAELMTGLIERSEVKASLSAITAALLAPVAPMLEGVNRLVFVPHGPLRYVPFAALSNPRPEGSESPLIDAFVLASALDAAGAVNWLSGSSRWPAAPGIRAVGSGSGFDRDGLGPLVFADKEVELIREEFPEARVLREDRASRAGLIGALSERGAVVHFAGHGRLDDRDPLAGRLVTSDGDLTLHEVLGLPIQSPLVVLSACETALAAHADVGGRLSGAEDWLSAAQAFQLAGADLVLASTFRVNDLAAALVMKRFYRGLRAAEPALALREAQQSARRFEPHPAWWATFTLMVR